MLANILSLKHLTQLIHSVLISNVMPEAATEFHYPAKLRSTFDQMILFKMQSYLLFCRSKGLAEEHPLQLCQSPHMQGCLCVSKQTVSCLMARASQI